MKKQETDYETVETTKTALYCDNHEAEFPPEHCMGHVGYAEDNDSLIPVFGRPQTRLDSADSSKVVDAERIGEFCAPCYNVMCGEIDALDSTIRESKDEIMRVQPEPVAYGTRRAFQQLASRMFLVGLISGVVAIMGVLAVSDGESLQSVYPITAAVLIGVCIGMMWYGYQSVQKSKTL